MAADPLKALAATKERLLLIQKCTNPKPCPYCDRAFKAIYDDLKAALALREQTADTLRNALERAGDAIHSEYCGSGDHHPECRAVTDALKVGLAGPPPAADREPQP